MATYEFQHVLDVEITAAIQNKGAFSLTTCCSLYEAVWKTPVSWEGLIHALVLLLCEDNAASSRPKWKQDPRVSVRICLVPWKSQGRKGLIPGGFTYEAKWKDAELCQHSTGWWVQGCQPGMALVQECGIASVPTRRQRKDAGFGLRTVLMYQWW